MWFLSSKVTVRESGILQGFCDCHCHLLPGVDDGVQAVEETWRILEIWQQMGMKEVWLTPHIMEDYPNMPTPLKERFARLTDAYTGSIMLHLAAEHMMDGPFLKRLNDGLVMPFGNDQDQLLVETSYYTPPMNMTETIERVKSSGYTPVLAHPERYQYMDRKDYLRWKGHGVLFQLNIPSLVGAYGLEVMHKAEWLLKENMYDLCGTDTHNTEQVEHFLESEISKKTIKRLSRIL